MLWKGKIHCYSQKHIWPKAGNRSIKQTWSHPPTHHVLQSFWLPTRAVNLAIPILMVVWPKAYNWEISAANNRQLNISTDSCNLSCDSREGSAKDLRELGLSLAEHLSIFFMVEYQKPISGTVDSNIIKHMLKCSNEGGAARRCVVEDGILLFIN